MGDNYIKWLSALSKKDISIAGEKGANLGEIYNSGFPVPSAFVITADAFSYFLKETKIQDEIRKLLSQINVDDGAKLEEKSNEIREIIINAKFPEVLEKEILESYDELNVDLEKYKASPGALSILKSSREPIFVSVRFSPISQDSDENNSFINVKGNKELLDKIKRCFASTFTSKSIYSRKKKGEDDFTAISVIVQRMVNSEKSGIIFSNNLKKNNGQILIKAIYGQGEGIASGKIRPDRYIVSRKFDIVEEDISNKKMEIIRNSSGQTVTKELGPEKSKSRVLKTYEIKQLAEYAIKIEEHYKEAQEIEIAISNEEIFILETKPLRYKENKDQKPHNNPHVDKPTIEEIDDEKSIGDEIAEIVEEKAEEFDEKYNSGEIEIIDEMPEDNNKSKKENIFS